jgi:signal transduction histidine kinase
MDRKRRGPRLSVEAKVLMPLLCLFALLPGALVLVELHPGARAWVLGHEDAVAALLGAVLLLALVQWLVVRAATRKMGRMRELAGVVGRGDFSRRVERYPNDQCGDLAEAFDNMSADLQESRVELEKAAESLRDTRERLVQSEKLSAVGQLVAGVAHELNNPLAVVVGFSEVLMETEKNEATRAHLDMVDKGAKRCHNIVKNLLGFARVHAPERKLIRINETLDQTIELLAYELRASGVEIIRDYQEAIPPIKADTHRLQQVFVNLVGNARQALEGFRPDPKIIVRTRARGGCVRVEIADNGPGIPRENLRRIFEPFFTTKPAGKGTGLGLSLVCEIVREHAGTVDVESEPGLGATFIVDIPITAEPVPFGKEPPRERRRDVRPAGSSGKVVLVVDDEEWRPGAHGGDGAGRRGRARRGPGAGIRRDRVRLEDAEDERRPVLREPRLPPARPGGPGPLHERGGD